MATMHPATVAAHFPLLNDQWLLRLHCPTLISQTLPGHSLVLNDTELTVALIKRGSDDVELYYTRTKDHPLRRLAEHQTIEIALAGKPIVIGDTTTPRIVVVADASGFAAAQAFVADQSEAGQPPALSLFDIGKTFPFRPRPSRFLVSGLPGHVIAAHPLCEEWGVASRLAEQEETHGCWEGCVHELLAAHVNHHTEQPAHVLAIGSAHLIAAVEKLTTGIAQITTHLIPPSQHLHKSGV